MQQKPVFQKQISLGNVIQIAVLLVGMSGAWFVMDNRSTNNADQITQTRVLVTALEVRLRTVENTQARSDERFSNILALLSQIDSRLERIEIRER